MEVGKDPLLLPVASMDKKKTALLPSVQLVAMHALFTALAVALVFGCTHIVHTACTCSPSSLFLPCMETTAAQDAEANALLNGMLWCTGPQAAAAALALLLPAHRRRSRRALTFVALTLAAAGHFMHARLVGLLLAVAPGAIFLVAVGIVEVFAAVMGDLLGFLALLFGGDD
ncbi:hypothetical protein ACP70R_042008 [Stipagrostis hirtigluma subsp. patula]